MAEWECVVCKRKNNEHAARCRVCGTKQSYDGQALQQHHARHVSAGEDSLRQQSYTKTMASPMHESRTESDIEMTSTEAIRRAHREGYEARLVQQGMAPDEARAKAAAREEYEESLGGGLRRELVFLAFAIVAFALFVCCLSCPVWAIVTWSLHADEMTAKAATATLLFSISGFVSYLAFCCAGGFIALFGAYGSNEDETGFVCGAGTFIGAFPTTSLALAIWGLQNLHGDEPNHIQIMFIAAICGNGFWVLSWTFFVTGLNLDYED